MGASSGGTETVTQSSEPWSQAQPYLRDIFGQAQNLYGQGQEYFPNSTVIPFHGATVEGLQGLRDHYSGSPLGLDAATDSLTGVASGQGATGSGRLASFALDGGTNPFTSDIRAAGARENTAGADVLQNMTQGGSNPYLDQIFNKASEQVRDNTAAMFSKAGRYGSAAHQDNLSDSLGDMAAQMYGNAYETDQNRRFSAAEALGAREAGDINRGMASASQLAGLGENAFSRSMSAAGQVDANAMAASSLLPMLNQYATSNDQGLMQVGGIHEGQAAQQMQDQLNRWNFSQNAPWDLLSRYNQTIQPIAGLGGTSTSTGPGQSTFNSVLQGGIGGGLLGSSLGGMLPLGLAGLSPLMGPIGVGAGILGSIL